MPSEAAPGLWRPQWQAAPQVGALMSTRAGGVSRAPWDSLNLGVAVGDDPAAVAENRRRVAAHFGADADHLNGCYQIHSAVARVADGPWRGDRPEGDAVVSVEPGLLCSVLTADCAPVLLADPETRAVAAVHAGWKGALGGVVHSAVTAMEALGADPRRLLAVVGPCIAQASYEVGLEFLDAFTAEAADNVEFFKPGETPDKAMFDLPGYVLHRLRRAGVGACEWLGRDTCAEEELFFSNRRAFKRSEPDFGRLMSAIALD